MQSFLQLVAHDLYAKIGNDLSRTVLVFPNKRANLFFTEYLAGESDQPIWSPAAMSISDLFRKLSVQKRVTLSGWSANYIKYSVKKRKPGNTGRLLFLGRAADQRFRRCR